MSEFSRPVGGGGRGENAADQWTLHPRGEEEATHPLLGSTPLEQNRDHATRQREGGDTGGILFQDETSILSEKESDTSPSRRTNGKLGFDWALAALGPKAHDPESVEKELRWQAQGRGNNEAAQEQFKTQVLAQRHLRLFAFMSTNSPYITLCHSVAQYFGEPGDEKKGLHGKYVAFVGDRTPSREPQMFILPPTAWNWIQPCVFAATKKLEDYYEDEESHHATLFPTPAMKRKKTKTTKGAATSTTTTDGDESDFRTVDIPQMLYLPTVIVKRVCDVQFWTPADLLTVVADMEMEYDIQLEPHLWITLKHWCLAATQAPKDTPNTSQVAFTVEAITQADEAFMEWCNYRLSSTMGALPAQTHAPILSNEFGPPPQSNTLQPTATANQHPPPHSRHQ